MIIALILLISIAIFIEFLEHNVEVQRTYEKCHEQRIGICKDILIDKKCDKCPYKE